MKRLGDLHELGKIYANFSENGVEIKCEKCKDHATFTPLSSNIIMCTHCHTVYEVEKVERIV